MPAMAHRVQVAVLEPTQHVRLIARRFARFDKTDHRQCSARPNGYGYHNAEFPISEFPSRTLIEYAPLDPADPLWPQKCAACAYEFDPLDDALVYAKSLWRSSEGPLLSLDEAPIGSLWHAYWMTAEWCGDDGLCLVVKTAAGEWWLDLPTGDGARIQRTGSPAHITTSSVIIRGQTFRLSDGYLISL